MGTMTPERAKERAREWLENWERDWTKKWRDQMEPDLAAVLLSVDSEARQEERTFRALRLATSRAVQEARRERDEYKSKASMASENFQKMTVACNLAEARLAEAEAFLNSSEIRKGQQILRADRDELRAEVERLKGEHDNANELRLALVQAEARLKEYKQSLIEASRVIHEEQGKLVQVVEASEELLEATRNWSDVRIHDARNKIRAALAAAKEEMNEL